ncbi:MAG: D-hexose-6-phosphate mutarotase [Hyphomicrobiaceae bacterium]
MADIDSLKAKFGVSGRISFGTTIWGADVIEIRNEDCRATLALAGAQLIDWTPEGEWPVIWLPAEPRLTPGKALRGGVPVCWPWFGAHPALADAPAHGFARTAKWVLEVAKETDDGTTLVLRLDVPEGSRPDWPHGAEAWLAITAGRTLLIDLETRNTGGTPFALTEALHTYFRIGEITDTLIVGLDGSTYLDALDGFARKIAPPVTTIAGEIDRVHLGRHSPIVICDEELRRHIVVESEGSESTVVWNPWIAKSERLGDMGEDGYRRMLCVETANAFDDARVLAPGETHRIAQTVSVHPI